MAGDYDLAYVALSLVPQFGTKKLASLLEHFESTDAILAASVRDLMQVSGIGKKTAERIHTIDLETLEASISRWQESGVRVITRQADAYPAALAKLDDAPLTLYMRGNCDITDVHPTIAIVGTRKPSKLAAQHAPRLAVFCAQRGYRVVSGLALGIDGAAHTGALESGTTPTIAVLGGGVLNIYPPQHRQLAERIAQHGALISENPPQATATAPRLVVRNRLISAFAQHIIVVETAIDGGAMYAVRAAQAQGKKIYTLDLSISGNQYLKENGATIINMDNPTLPPAVN